MKKKKLVEIVLNAPAEWGIYYLTAIAEGADKLNDVGAQYLDDICASLFAGARKEVA